jgi:hypothetical protein
MSDKKTLTVKLVKSPPAPAVAPRHRARPGPAQAQQPAHAGRHAAVRGMINKVSYLVQVL